MDIMDLGAIGELVGGVAVIASLLYLGLQVRQSTRASRAASYQAAVSSVSEWTRCLGSDGALAILFDKGSHDPSSQSEEEQLQYAYLLNSVVRNFENIHYQYESGFMDEDKWGPWEARIRGMLGTPGACLWWESQGAAFGVSFREVVDRDSGGAIPLPTAPATVRER